MTTLRRALLANSIFSIVTGLAMTLTAEGLASRLAVPPLSIVIVGVGVLIFGSLIAVQVARGRISQEFAAVVIGLDLAWVLGAIAILLIPGSISDGWILAGVSLGVAGLAAWQLLGLVRLTRERPRSIETSVHIDGSPEEVWADLTDFHSYSAWNPFILEASGQPSTGEALKLTMKSGERTMEFAPVVTTAEAPSSLEWLGAMGTGAIFDGRHRFEVLEQGRGSRLVQSEEFSGFLVPFVWRSIGSSTREGFEAMNQALKQRVEGKRRQSA